MLKTHLKYANQAKDLRKCKPNMNTIKKEKNAQCAEAKKSRVSLSVFLC